MIERKWRAGYSERGKSGSEGGLCKPTVVIQQGDTCLPYIYVSFWNSDDNWSLQTEEEINSIQSEDLTDEPDIGMTM